MVAKANRILAVTFAAGLGVGETVINWGDWQYAPLWFVDYIIVIALLIGAFQTSPHRSASTLKAAWAFSFGVMYMALFISMDPEMAQYYDASSTILFLIGLLMILSAVGLALSHISEKSLTSRQS
jgi:hypothetical protein